MSDPLHTTYPVQTPDQRIADGEIRCNKRDYGPKMRRATHPARSADEAKWRRDLTDWQGPGRKLGPKQARYELNLGHRRGRRSSDQIRSERMGHG